MLVDLSHLITWPRPYNETPDERHIKALVAVAERLERLCDLVERAQRPDGTIKREKPL